MCSRHAPPLPLPCPSPGLSFEDSVYVRCYLVADPFLNGTIDTAGWNAAYGMFFNKPGSTRVGGP